MGEPEKEGWLSRIVTAPAPRWMRRMRLRALARRMEGCADLLLESGSVAEYDLAAEARTLARRVSELAELE